MASKKKLVPPPEIAEPERLGKSQQKLDAILNDEIISKQYNKVTEKLDAWERKTFKGQWALGPIPGWFLDNDVIRLSIAREWLTRRWDKEKRKFVKRYSLKEIRKMMSEYRYAIENSKYVPFEPEAQGHVSVVCSCDDAIAAGPKKGLQMMLGKEDAKHIEVGSKVIKGGHNANIKTYGTKKDREKEHEEWEKEAFNIQSHHPKWNWYKIADEVGKKFSKCGRTVRKHVKNVCK